jgi:hypothetical protein
MLRRTVALWMLGLLSVIPAAMAGDSPGKPPGPKGPTDPGPLSYEGENLAPPFGEPATEGTVTIQEMAQFGNQWSHNAQALWTPTKPGGSLSTKILVGMKVDAVYVFSVAYTKAPDYGQVQLFVNNKAVGAPFDGYAPQVTYGGPVTLGTGILLKGPAWNQIRFTVVGKNPKSTGYYVGIDLMKFTPFVVLPGGFAPKSGFWDILKKLP